MQLKCQGMVNLKLGISYRCFTKKKNCFLNDSALNIRVPARLTKLRRD